MKNQEVEKMRKKVELYDSYEKDLAALRRHLEDIEKAILECSDNDGKPVLSINIQKKRQRWLFGERRNMARSLKNPSLTKYLEEEAVELLKIHRCTIKNLIQRLERQKDEFSFFN